MVKDNELVGAIAIYRPEVRPFTDKQVQLVTGFAAQAVIAIENTRLLHELRQRTNDLSEALEQQTATSEVLRVISSSSGDLELVFQAMLKNATRICDAKFGIVISLRWYGVQLGRWLRYAACRWSNSKSSAGRSYPGPDFFGRMLQTKQVSHANDAAEDAEPGIAAKLGGARSSVAVPMVQEDELVGAIVIYRQEVRPFTDKQIELVQSFAAQAVIAIENTRRRQ